MTGHGNVRPEKFREHADDCRDFYNIDREVQIQSQIVFISAYETLIKILIEWKDRGVFTHTAETRQTHDSWLRKSHVGSFLRWGL